jgi:hypothetical protein
VDGQSYREVEMAIDVIANGQHGKVIVRRANTDGTVVLLVCEEFESVDEMIGPVLVPVTPDHEERERLPDPEKRSRYPMLAQFIEQPLVIDVSPLPEGILQFAPEPFARQAISMLSQGVHDVELDEDLAREFGFRGLGQSKAEPV